MRKEAEDLLKKLHSEGPVSLHGGGGANLWAETAAHLLGKTGGGVALMESLGGGSGIGGFVLAPRSARASLPAAAGSAAPRPPYLRIETSEGGNAIHLWLGPDAEGWEYALSRSLRRTPWSEPGLRDELDTAWLLAAAAAHDEVCRKGDPDAAFEPPDGSEDEPAEAVRSRAAKSAACSALLLTLLGGSGPATALADLRLHACAEHTRRTPAGGPPPGLVHGTVDAEDAAIEAAERMKAEGRGHTLVEILAEARRIGGEYGGGRLEADGKAVSELRDAAGPSAPQNLADALLAASAGRDLPQSAGRFVDRTAVAWARLYGADSVARAPLRGLDLHSGLRMGLRAGEILAAAARTRAASKGGKAQPARKTTAAAIQMQTAAPTAPSPSRFLPERPEGSEKASEKAPEEAAGDPTRALDSKPADPAETKDSDPTSDTKTPHPTEVGAAEASAPAFDLQTAVDAFASFSLGDEEEPDIAELLIEAQKQGRGGAAAEPAAAPAGPQTAGDDLQEAAGANGNGKAGGGGTKGLHIDDAATFFEDEISMEPVLGGFDDVGTERLISLYQANLSEMDDMRTGAGNPQEDQRHDRLEMGRRRLGEELIVRRAMPRRFIDRHARDLISAAAATLPERIRSPKAAEAAARSMELALGDGTGQEAAWEPVQTDP